MPTMLKDRLNGKLFEARAVIKLKDQGVKCESDGCR